MAKWIKVLLISMTIFFIVLVMFMKKDAHYLPLRNGQNVSENWVLHIEEISPSRRKVTLENKVTQSTVVVFNYLLYTSEMSLVGKILQHEGSDYLIARINNEGSNDTLYFAVYKLTPNQGIKLTENNYTWACSNPIKKGKQLYFYGDTLSSDVDCFFLLSNIGFFKKEVSVVTLE